MAWPLSSRRCHSMAQDTAFAHFTIYCARRLRLTALFALRYEQKGTAAINALLQRLRSLGIPSEMLDVVPTLLRHCGSACRVGDLYSDRSFATRFATRAKANLRVRGPVLCKSDIIILQAWEQLSREGPVLRAVLCHPIRHPSQSRPQGAAPHAVFEFQIFCIIRGLQSKVGARSALSYPACLHHEHIGGLYSDRSFATRFAARAKANLRVRAPLKRVGLFVSPCRAGKGWWVINPWVWGCSFLHSMPV